MAPVVATGESGRTSTTGRLPSPLVLAALAIFLLGCALMAITIGAAGIPFPRLISASTVDIRTRHLLGR